LVFFLIGRKHFTVARCAAIQFHEMFFPKIDILLAVPAIMNWLFEQLAKCFFKIRQVDSVLRSFWSVDTRLYVGQLQIDLDAPIPPTPQPTTPRSMIIVVCESVPTRVSGK